MLLKCLNDFILSFCRPSSNVKIVAYKNRLLSHWSMCAEFPWSQFTSQTTVLLCIINMIVNRQTWALLTYFHHHAIVSQNCLSHTLMTKAELKSLSHFEQTFYVDHYHRFFFFFFVVFKDTDNVWDATLINWVINVSWGVTGDTGAVVKLGQSQTPQPWLPLFLSEKHIL